MEESSSTELVACCGLYCGDCYRYKGKLADLSRDLRKELRTEKFSETAEKLGRNAFFKIFRDFPQCYEVLGAIVRLRCAKACRGGGGPPICKIRACVEKKGIQGCWECTEYHACKKLDFLVDYHGEAHIRNLDILQQAGIDSFISGKRYW